MHLEEYCLFGHMFHIPGKLKMAKGDGMMGQYLGLQRWMATAMTMKSGKQPDLRTILTSRNRLYSPDALPFTEFFEDSLEHLGVPEWIIWWKL